MPSRFIHVVTCQNLLSFYGWIIFHCMYIYHNLCIHPCGHFWLLWVTLLWVLVYKYLFKSQHLIHLSIYPEVELLDYMLILWPITILFSPGVVPFYIPTNSEQGFHEITNFAMTFFLIIVHSNYRTLRECKKANRRKSNPPFSNYIWPEYGLSTTGRGGVISLGRFYDSARACDPRIVLRPALPDRIYRPGIPAVPRPSSIMFMQLNWLLSHIRGVFPDGTQVWRGVVTFSVGLPPHL